MNTQILNTIEELTNSFTQIPIDRKELLASCAQSIQSQLNLKQKSQLMVICTHNSRRSQLGELWLDVAANHYNVDVDSFSGGSEATAFNHRMVNALIDTGFNFTLIEAGPNPKYTVSYDSKQVKNSFFSKVYSDSFNPQSDFIAILVCHSADMACPTIFGADDRFFIPYVDPKHADDSTDEAKVYGEKVKEIGREMLYLMSLIQ